MEKGTIDYRKITETYGKLIMKNYGNYGSTQRTTGNSEKLLKHMGNYRL